MAHQDPLIHQDIDAYIRQHQNKSLLRFITCGSVDDGKSTLIGRLLYDSKMLFEDQLQALEADSRKVGTQGDHLDFALLVDGLAAEREQGITIDVAYRYFSTATRQFIVADTPGHEQYTRNMVTGASTADAAIVLVDARKGLLTQTRRHTYLLSLMGIRHVVLAVNKMDLVGHDPAVFDAIARDYASLAGRLGIPDVAAIPVSGLRGDNILDRSTHMPWYAGPTLMAWLEAVKVEQHAFVAPARFPVQWVNRPHQDFRGYAGTLASGTLQVGERVRVQPSGRETTLAAIHTHNGAKASAIERAIAGQAVTLLLADEVDAARGDVIVPAQSPACVANQFLAHLVWMNDEPLFPGRHYLLQCGTQSVPATVTRIKHEVNMDTLDERAADKLTLNAVAQVNMSTERPLVFDPYLQNRQAGAFIMVDRLSFQTVGAGMITHELRRATNIQPQHFVIGKAERAAMNGQTPRVLWFTGLSGSGKSTIANQLEKSLFARGLRTYVLDGDNLRHGLNKDLGFTEQDRIENIRRAAEVAKLMMDAGLIVITTFISPFRADREAARALFKPGEFLEVFIDTPLAVCEDRDPKGLYRKARAGQVRNFTGIDSPYEPPLNAELVIDGSEGLDASACAQRILDHILPQPPG